MPMPAPLAGGPPPFHRKRTGFTLLETAIAVFLMSLIFLGTIALFTSAGTTGMKVTAANSAATTSAQALQTVCDEIKEAFWVSLPDDSVVSAGIAWPAFLEVSKFKNSAASPTKYTGIYVYSPPAQNAALGGVSTISILDRSGQGQPLCLIHRGDANGSANPDGEYLWKQPAAGGQPEKIASNIAHSPDAVQFKRLSSGLTKSIDVKIVCGEFSRIIGEQTNDATDGSKVSGIAGRTVELRNTSIANVAVAPPPNNIN